MHPNQRKNSGGYVVKHNSSTLGKFLQLAHWRGLDDIERSKKYKTHQKSFPCERRADQCDQLTSYLVDYDELRIFDCGGTRHLRRGWNAGQNR